MKGGNFFFLNKELYGYYLVSILAIILSYLLLILLYQLNIYYLVITSICFVFALLIRYSLLGKLVFKKKILNKKSFVKFIYIYIGMFFLYSFLIYILHGLLNINLIIAHPVIIIFLSPLNFLMIKKIY